MFLFQTAVILIYAENTAKIENNKILPNSNNFVQLKKRGKKLNYEEISRKIDMIFDLKA